MGKNTNKIKKNKTKDNFNWYILFIISLTSVVGGIYRDGFAALFPFLQRDFNLTRAQLGLHSTLFYLTSASVALYTGRLVDLKGSKWGLVFGSFALGIFFILHTLAPNFLVLLLVAALTGIAVSINTPTASKGIVEWFSKKQRGFALGIQSIAFPIGGLLGAVFLPLLSSFMGWRKTIIIPGLVSILFALFIKQFYQQKKRVVNNTLAGGKSNPSFFKYFFHLIQNRELIVISIFGFFLGTASGVMASHFTLFLFLDYNLSETVAGLGFAAFQLGSILGRPVWCLISDSLLAYNKGKAFLFLGFVFTFITFTFSIFLKNFATPPLSVLFLLTFLAGFSGNGWPGLYTASVTEVVEEDNVGIAIGLSLLFARFGLMIAPPIFGYIADLRGSYNLSWFLLGAIILVTSLIQYLFSPKKKEVPG